MVRRYTVVRKRPHHVLCSLQGPNVNLEMPDWNLSVWDTTMLLSDVGLKKTIIKDLKNICMHISIRSYFDFGGGIFGGGEGGKILGGGEVRFFIKIDTVAFK